MGDKIYGEFAVGSGPGAISTLRVDHIMGGRLLRDKAGRPEFVLLWFQAAGGPQELQLDFPNALFLLSVLKCIQLDSGVPFPDDPRG